MMHFRNMSDLAGYLSNLKTPLVLELLPNCITTLTLTGSVIVLDYRSVNDTNSRIEFALTDSFIKLIRMMSLLSIECDLSGGIRPEYAYTCLRRYIIDELGLHDIHSIISSLSKRTRRLSMSFSDITCRLSVTLDRELKIITRRGKQSISVEVMSSTTPIGDLAAYLVDVIADGGNGIVISETEIRIILTDLKEGNYVHSPTAD